MVASRRGFLGGLAAAPAMAKAGLVSAGQSLPEAQLTGVSQALAGTASAYGSLNAKIADQSDWLTTRAAQLAKEIAGLGSERPKMFRECLRQVSRLDPDLAESKALSLSARVRLQASRDVERQIESRSGWLSQELAAIKAQIGF